MGGRDAEKDAKTFIVPRGGAHARGFLCTPVDEATACRSSVLSSLMDCEGVVELPPDVCMDDLHTWSQLLPTQAPKMSSEELTHALKVPLLGSYPPMLSFPT